MSAESGWKPNFQDTTSAGKMPVLRMQHFAEGGDAFLVLVHRTDGDADPFWQVVAFHRADDHFALKQGSENRETIVNVHQNKIRCAGNEGEFHRGKFFF